MVDGAKAACDKGRIHLNTDFIRARRDSSKRTVEKMKEYVKSVLPPPLLDLARKYISHSQLFMTPVRNFIPDNLKPLSDTDIECVFSNPAFSPSWEIDHKSIKSVYGDEDNLGGVNPGDRRALYYLIMAFVPGHVLEIGTHIGASTLHMACALKQLGNKHSKITTVDIADVNHPETAAWTDIGLAASPSKFAKRLGCLDYIDFRTMPSLDWMRTVKHRYDFIFLDGDHSATAVYQEVSAALRLLNPGGVILLHDYYPEGKVLFPDRNIVVGPYTALERIKKETRSLTVLPLGDLPWPTKQGTHSTSLALVTRSRRQG